MEASQRMEETTLSLMLGFAGLCVTQAVIWSEGRRRANQTDAKIDVTDAKIDVASANADTAASSAELAAERSKPTSNGFAEEVKDGLNTLLEGQSLQATEIHEIRVKLDRHLGDHASADVMRRPI
jgi:hypothetical protein